MRLAFISLSVLILLNGCMPNQCLSAAAEAQNNVVNLSRIDVGMNQAEVLKIVRHPYSDQVFEIDGDTYDVWFYVTRRVVLGQSRMLPMNLTPLTFKNGILIGRGLSYYTLVKARKLQDEKEKMAPIETIQTPVHKKDDTEDKLLEDFLQKSIEKTPSSQDLPVPIQPEPSSKPRKLKRTPPKQSRPKEAPLDLSPLEPSPPQNIAPQQKKGQNQKGSPQSKSRDGSPDWSPIAPPSPAQPKGGTGKQKQKQKPSQGPSQQPQNSPDWSPIGPQAPPQPNGGTGPKNKKEKPAQGPSQPSQGSPDWSPLEEQAPPQQTPPQPDSQQNTGPQQVSMSGKTKDRSEEKPDKKTDQKNKPEKKPFPLNEGDEEMLKDERAQDFNQT